MVAIVLVFGAIVFVLWLGAHAVMEGGMTAGELGQFILYSVGWNEKDDGGEVGKVMNDDKECDWVWEYPRK